MKTKRIRLKIRGLIPLAMAALMTLTLGCEELPPPPPVDPPIDETQYLGYVTAETFKVHPLGTEVSALNGTVLLNFPEGAVSVPTVFVIATISTNHLDVDGINIYDKGFCLKGESPYQALQNVTIQVKYDLEPESWKMDPPEAEQNLRLSFVYPDLEDYQIMRPFEDCCVDCESKTIQSGLNNCGYFLIREN